MVTTFALLMRNSIDAAYNESPVPSAKAVEIIGRLAELNVSIVYCEHDEIQIDNAIQLTFLGYSGGGQIAYSTAQKLTGRLFVDNLVLFGSPFRAYNGVSNIGRIWELWGQEDLASTYRSEFVRWDSENRGLRGGYPTTYDQALDIYSNGATRCTLFSDAIAPGFDDFYGHGSYFDRSQADDGRSCGTTWGPQWNWNATSSSNASRFRANIDFLIDVVGVGRKERR